MRFLVLLAALTASAALSQPGDLTGPWRFHAGDDPRWAQPDFDDRANDWSTFELPRGTRPRPLGWSWLRCSITVPPGDLSVALGIVGVSYDVYLNGVKIGQAGIPGDTDPPFHLPQAFPIPPGLLRPGTPAVLALRVFNPVVSWTLIGSVADTGPYRLTDPDASRDLVQLHRLSLQRAGTPFVILATVQGAMFILIAIFWNSMRQRKDVLCFGLFLLAAFTINLVSYFTVGTGARFPSFLSAAVFGLTLCWVAHLLAPTRKGRTIDRRLVAQVALALLISAWVLPVISYGVILLFPAWWALRALVGLDAEQRLFAVPVLLSTVAGASASIQRYWSSYPVPSVVQLDGYIIPLASIVTSATSLAMVILLLRSMEREKSRLAGEFQAARSVQQLLIANSQSPRLDAFYQPAQEVGGDFYQIFPLPDGSELLAVGDVSGKGLKAAMAVSMITGALRNRHAETPAALLAELNRAVAGGLDGGFVTARLYPDGRLTLASAGHPSPYLNGQELTLEPGLPLGIYREAEYADTETNLPPNQPLTFVSDGVIEAANAKNELLGFDRTQALSLRPAAEIAQAAQSWGQNDDITVAILQRAT